MSLDLILTYINDILKAFKNAVPKPFADDTNILIFHKTKATKQKMLLFKIGNTEVDFLENWALANKLSASIGIEKENFFYFLPSNQNERKNNLPDLKLLGQNIPLTQNI